MTAADPVVTAAGLTPRTVSGPGRIGSVGTGGGVDAVCASTKGTLSPMASFEAQTLVNARGSTIWDIITDAGNFPVWESGITAVTGGLRNGGTIRIRTRRRGRKVRLRVEQIPGEVMTWTTGIPPQLAVFKRTFVLMPRDAMTVLVIRDEICGPLRAFVRSPFDFTELHLTELANAVKERAELIG